MTIQMYKLINEYMNIFIYHLHGDTLFTAFSQARDIIILQLIQSLLFYHCKTKHHTLSTHTGFYFQGLSALLGVKGIILQVETSIKAQRQQQHEDTH